MTDDFADLVETVDLEARRTRRRDHYRRCVLWLNRIQRQEAEEK